MKTSLYNNILHINNEHTLIYNSFSGIFVIIKNEILTISDIHNTLNQGISAPRFACFVKAGIFIDNNIDETARLKQKIDDAENNEDEFILHINTTLDCNFNCWYCYENHIKKSQINEDVLIAIKRFISSIIHNKPNLKRFEIGFFGGEPLLHSQNSIKHIIEHTYNECKTKNINLDIHFTSNGSLITPSLIEYIKQFTTGFQITLDGGKAHHDKTRFFGNQKGSYDVILGNIVLLANNNISTIVRINYTSDNIDSIPSILTSLALIDRKEVLAIDLQRVWQDKISKSDTTEIKANIIRHQFRKAGFHVLSNYIPHNVTDACYGDKKNHLLINYDGFVFACTARDFTEANSIGKLTSNGSIIYNEDKLLQRNRSKFSKQICKQCRIAPICGGGCKQRAYEDRNPDSCTLGYTEKDKDNIILDIFDFFYCSENLD